LLVAIAPACSDGESPEVSGSKHVVLTVPRAKLLYLARDGAICAQRLPEFHNSLVTRERGLSMSDRPISITGKIGGITETDSARLSAVALRANTVLATAQVRADGSYQLNVPAKVALGDSAYALQVAVLPITAAANPNRVPDAPRASIARPAIDAKGPVHAPSLNLSPALIDSWGIFWREWCVSGTIVGPNGCPVPAAEVTVYTVAWTSSGYTEVPRGTVTTGPNGTFSICFPWWDGLFPCWPCEPFWWLCWPWWWELDILHVIDALEARATSGSQAVALFPPDSSALIRGQGFAAAALGGVAQPDAARTALISRKFANPALRALFPWWWWCCDQPNIIFGASQGGTIILAEDPSVGTRWCMGSGESVTLTANQNALTNCPGPPLPEVGYVWTSVGNILTTSIDSGGLAQAGGDNSDVAFQGGLNLYAAIADGAFDYYQVNSSVWDAPKSRGGTQPPAAVAPAASPISASLWLPVWIWDPAAGTTTAYNVQMGPFTANGHSGLYATTNARQSLAAPAGLAPFPPIPAGGEVFWGEEGLVLVAGDTTLLGGLPFGGVDLTLLGYDKNFNPVPVAPGTPDAPLTLTIDSTPLTTQSVNGITAWVAPGQPASQTGTGPCPAYDVGPNGFVEVSVTVQDNNGFVCQYDLEAQYGNSMSPVVTPPGVRGYKINPPPAPVNPDYATANWTAGTETITFPGATLGGALPPDCCYEFRVYSCKRVTDGYYWPAGDRGEGPFQTISLKFSS
jgi:hypothetical protein